MSNEYRVTGELPVLDTKPGDTFEHDLTADEEQTLVGQGRIEIVARPYKVVGHRPVGGAAPGDTFTAALTVGEEQALIDGGHVERVRRTEKAKQAIPIPTTTTAAKKED